MTPVEWLVIASIIAVLLALLLPLLPRSAGEAPKPDDTRLLQTVRHEGHLWVISWRVDGLYHHHAAHFAHHPDCPCRGIPCEAP